MASTTMSMKLDKPSQAKLGYIWKNDSILEILVLPCVYVESLKASLTQDAVNRSHSRQDALFYMHGAGTPWC